MRGVFVTGTGTGVGKSVVAACLAATLVERGERVVAAKPVISGLDDAPGPPWPHDHELLALATGDDPEAVAPHRFGPAVSPHLAARLAGERLSVAGLADDLERRVAGAAADLPGGAREPILVVEGAGGLLVPLADEPGLATVADLAVRLALRLVVAASPGLGTINHTLLTLEAARARRLEIAAVVLTPWPDHPSEIEVDNRALLEREAGAPVLALGRVAEPRPASLARAGLQAGLGRLA